MRNVVDRLSFQQEIERKTARLFAGMLAIACALGFGLGSGSAAAGEVSGHVALLSHYKWAGADQNFYEDKQIFPTAQASIFYTFDNGVYVGNWASTIKFLDNNRIDSTAYLGYFTKLGPGALDLSVGYNFYPGAASANTTALYAIYSISYFALKWTGVISDKYVGLPEGRGRQAIAVAGKYDLNDTWAVKGELGRLFLTEGLRRQGLQEKAWYLVGLDYKLQKDLLLGAVITGADPVSAQRIGWRDRSRLVVSLTKNF